MNNQLDGFDDGLRYGEKQFAHWDFVPVVMILDPTQMDGLGPPRNNRLPDLPPATPYAYAFLDRPSDTTIPHVPDYEGAQRQKLDNKLPLEETAAFDDIRRSTHNPVPGTDPWFEVSIKDRAMLIVDRHLRLITAEPQNNELIGINTEYWQPYWHPIIQDGKYVGE